MSAQEQAQGKAQEEIALANALLALRGWAGFTNATCKLTREGAAALLRSRDEAWADLTATRQAREEAERERDEAQRQFELELDGNATIRSKFGARDDESFYAFIQRLAAAEALRDQAMQLIQKFMDKWALVEPRINGVFALQYVRMGTQYDGPNLGEELDALRAALSEGKE